MYIYKSIYIYIYIYIYRSITTISESVINITHYSRKSLHFDKTSAWVKKGNNSLFDITMGSYDGAKICEFVELYLFNRLNAVIVKVVLIYIEMIGLLL